MNVRVERGDITQFKTDTVVVNLFEGVKHPEGAMGALDEALGGLLHLAIQDGELTGKLNEVVVLRAPARVPFKRVAVAGLGKAKEFTLDRVRQVSASVANRLRAMNVNRYATILHGAGLGDLDPEAIAQAMTEGAWLSGYRFLKYKTGEAAVGKAVKEMVLVDQDPKTAVAAKRGLAAGEIIARAVCAARDLVNEPSNVLTPTAMAAEVQKAAKRLKLSCKILNRAECERMGMGAFLSVTKGTDQPPKFAVLEYRGGRPKEAWVALVGKGVMYDTGGISLKPGGGGEGMKGDMAGAAACFQALCAAAELKVPVNAVAILPMVENMPSGKASKPGDVVTALSGKTVEILNTDAEGRLILCDALAYSERYDLKAVVDMATLTGAVSTALGREYAAILGTDAAVVDRVRLAGLRTAERVWELPVGQEYDYLVKGSVADTKNVGDGTAGTIAGGVFLKKHVKASTPWAHVDIAAVFFENSGKPYVPKGGTGFGVRLLTQLLRDFASSGR